MGKRLILIIILFISILLLPLPLYARGGFKGGGFGKLKGGGLGGVKRSGGGKYDVLGSLFGDSGDYLPPAAKSHGILSIMVKSQDAEIYVNGRFIGRAKDFKGPALVSVPAGKHVVEFRYDGLVIPTQEFNVIPSSTTFIVRDKFELNAKSP